MLETERQRCVRVLESIENELISLSKGSFLYRKVVIGEKQYLYPCLKRREGKKVILEHVRKGEEDIVKADVSKRQKLLMDKRVLKTRVNTLDRLLSINVPSPKDPHASGLEDPSTKIGKTKMRANTNQLRPV